MSRSAYTVKVFGNYLLILGVALILVPNVLLSIFGISHTSEVWIRLVGVVGFNMGIAFWLLGFVAPAVILFGVIDVLGGAWTHVTLKSQDRA